MVQTHLKLNGLMCVDMFNKLVCLQLEGLILFSLHPSTVTLVHINNKWLISTSFHRPRKKYESEVLVYTPAKKYKSQLIACHPFYNVLRFYACAKLRAPLRV